MTREQILKLTSIGVDIEPTLERFVDNETLYFKCLRTFMSNKEYPGLLLAIEEKDVNAAFDYAHALKGVTANLGFNNLFNQVNIITEVFRSGSLNYDPNNLTAIKKEYDTVIDTILSLDN